MRISKKRLEVLLCKTLALMVEVLIQKIIGKILGTRPELRSMTGQIIPEIQSIVKEVNAMSAADQIAELKSEYSDLTKPKPKQKQRDLPELKDAKKGGVVTILNLAVIRI